MNYFPMTVEAEAVQTKAGGLRGFLASRIRSADICEFYRQMADLIGAGIPLVKALQVVAGQSTSPAMRAIIATVAGDVQGGDTFAQALEKHARSFPRLAVALVNSGEKGGFLPDVLQQLAGFAELEEEIKGKVRAAMAYPLVMVFVGIAVVTFLMSFVMPKIVGMYAEMQQTLPGPTQALIAISGFMRSYWHVLIAGLVIAGALIWRSAKTTEGRGFINRAQLRAPILGEILLRREISRFARTLGQLLKNGVPILTALDIVKEVATNVVVRQAIERVPPDITQGEGISGSLRKRGLFPPGLINMIAVGEETGRLPDTLLQVAPSYEAQADRSIKALTALIEPLVILCMGVVVGFIVIAMLLPILTLDPTAGQ
jgi:type II secretory pathway component PulF